MMSRSARSVAEASLPGGPSSGLAMTSLALSMVLASLGVSIPYVALPTLTEAFGVSFQAVQWIVIAYLLAITALVVGIGRLGDILGHRRVLLAGIVLFTVASIVCAAAPSFWVLIAGRAMQGAGAAALMALTLVMARQVVPREATGSAMGLLGTMSAIGTALGPTLGGLLTAGPGWRAIFLILVPLGVLNLLLARRALPEAVEVMQRDRGQFDALGTLLLGLSVGAYALALTMGDGASGGVNFALLLGALAAGSLFVFAESRARSPLIQLSALRDVKLSSSLAINALTSTVIMATLVVGPFYLSRALGLGEALVGLVVSVGPVVAALSGVPAGRLVDRFGVPVILVAGLAQIAAGSVALALLPATLGIAGYVASIAVLTSGYQLFLAANNTAVMIDVGEDQRGVISGMLTLSRNLGLTTGASLMGAVFAFAAGTQDMRTAPADVVAFGMRMTFAFAAALMVVAVVIAIASRWGALARARSGHAR
jgi:MFS family permease